ncbi:NAD-dependent epimerase/dehydratase family protein [Amycolatopsis mongoliensis]|uniref:NAD-dependent epimerase/dehydratase family protein n=1 Tax=Amycolatopsis mongoliensis TaxID=715475 RepID=A0A9Y2NDQ9_9PSEU|nr:NAD-dependent epimerase/dehydratase family protein [Amycolatopsis sp. 4-36]WIY00962.1 NAD-dependent epimerase/dehydratase family protein [Amycolatopsis sp. 4-36]
MKQTPHPAAPKDEDQLEDLLSAPLEGVGTDLAALGGDVVLLGAGGKIGPTMTLMARRALDAAGSTATVHAVSRWSEPDVRDSLERQGVRTHSAELGDPDSVRTLPDAAGVFHLAALKFGTTGAEQRMWWTNAAIPAMVADRYRGVPTVVYSSGNVYPLTPLAHGGCTERDEPRPNGEYAQSCLARERVFAAASERWGTPTVMFRLNYACELRYGVLADIATRIAGGRPVDVTMPAVNVVWQRDVSAWALRSILLADPAAPVLNATGPETIPVRRIASLLAEAMAADVEFTGSEAPDALLNDAGDCFARFGYPSLAARTLIAWTAEWVRGGGRQLGKATKFEQRQGRY